MCRPYGFLPKKRKNGEYQLRVAIEGTLRLAWFLNAELFLSRNLATFNLSTWLWCFVLSIDYFYQIV